MHANRRAFTMVGILLGLVLASIGLGLMVWGVLLASNSGGVVFAGGAMLIFLGAVVIVKL